MAAIKNKNTKPEMMIRRWLFARGYRFRVNVDYIPGHPDLYFRKYNTAIFVHGCYWHRHTGCKYAYTPKSNQSFWIPKFSSNVKRDNEIKHILIEKGINCIVVWECTLKKMAKNSEFREETLDEMEKCLRRNPSYSEF